MKFDFDKLNLSQKIYAVIGAIIAVVVYIFDKENLNIAIGVLLLTFIFVYLMRYPRLKKIFNFIIVFSLIFSIVIVGKSLVSNYINERNNPYTVDEGLMGKDYSKMSDEELLNDIEITLSDNNKRYYLVVTSDLGDYRSGTIEEYIIKFDNQQQCVESLDVQKNISKGFISAECLGDNVSYRKLFNNKPIGKWYIRIDPYRKVATGNDVALVYKFKVEPKESEMDSLIINRIDGLKKLNKNLEIIVVSPNGNITKG